MAIIEPHEEDVSCAEGRATFSESQQRLAQSLCFCATSEKIPIPQLRDASEFRVWGLQMTIIRVNVMAVFLLHHH